MTVETKGTATAAVKTMSPKRIEKAREAFFQGLPKRITCTSCGRSRKKEAFGVRLMNRVDVETKGKNPVFRRQSYCVTCRHSPKAAKE